MYWLYSTLLALGLLLSLPYWLMQRLRHGKYRAGMGERLGRVPNRLVVVPGRPVIWVHAVSVGEVLAVTGLVAEARRYFPGKRIVISTTTDTGQKLAQERFGEENVFYFPVDFAFAILPYLRRLRPELIVIAETEFWPNYLRLAKREGARIAVVNARISDRSQPGYRRWRRVLAKILSPVDLFLAQTDEDRKRLIEIGARAERVQVSGNLKFDFADAAALPIVARLHAAFQQAEAGPVLVCGSTVEGEEAMILAAFQTLLANFPRAVMLLAPRHPERFGEVMQLLGKLPIRHWRRTQWNGEPIAGGVFLLDSIGELASLYALGDVAFVGGSLVPRGGHNILEPARYGVAIVVGSHTENFRDVVRLFQSCDAVRITSPSELTETLRLLLSDEEERKSLGRRAAETLRAHQGATRRTLEALGALIQQSTGKATAVSRKERGDAPLPR